MDKGLTLTIRQEKPVSMDVTFNCNPGELLALIGPSGSGKSTILRTIAGLHRAQSADICCAGNVWNESTQAFHMPAQKRKVGLVFQEYALFPHKSVLDNVMLATQGGSKSERSKKAMSQLRRTNMEGLESRKPATLSGGQKQRVALARALAREPAVLLLDEPFSAVDQATRRRLYRELAMLRKTLEIPIILVTHDLTEVQLLADSLCLIHRGQSLQQGEVADVVNRPQSRQIARLLGHQNIFNATLIKHTDKHSLYQIGEIPPVLGPKLENLNTGDKASLLISPSAIEIEHPFSDTQDRIPLDGKVLECVPLGDEFVIRLRLERIQKSMRFKVPMHMAQEFGIEQGRNIRISVQTHGIHAMPS